MELSERDLIYLYCVTEKVPELRRVEKLIDNKLHFIYYQGIYAVISIVSDNEFSEENLRKNLSDMEWIGIKAGIHEKVIEEIMNGACVIPFKFATLFYSEDSLKMSLEKRAEEFKENLKRLGGKEEWGAKVYCDVKRLRNYIVREDEEILKTDREINSSSPGKAFFLRKKKEELLNTLVNKKLNEYGQAGFDRLREKSLEACINKLLPKEVTENKDEMILNSSFLIDKNKVVDFLNIVDGLRTEYTGRGLFFDCTGPWPPYNFCPLNNKKAIKNE